MQRKDLYNIIAYEKDLYGMKFTSRIRGIIACEPMYQTWKWLKASRYYDYYYSEYTRTRSFKYNLLSLFYAHKRNKLAERLGIDVNTKNVSKGLMLYHLGATVINGGSVIGENCKLHGNNCIGNAGPADSKCPRIGKNVEIGVGAKIIGDVTIADNIIIGAGAIVVNSFLDAGITIAGVPAKRIK